MEWCLTRDTWPSATHLLSTFQKSHYAHFRKCGNLTVKTVRNLRPNSTRPPPCPPYLDTADTALASDWTQIPVWTIQLQNCSEDLWAGSPRPVIIHPPGTNYRIYFTEEFARAGTRKMLDIWMCASRFTGIIGTRLTGRSVKTVFDDKMSLGSSPSKAHHQKDDLRRAQSGSATEKP